MICFTRLPLLQYCKQQTLGWEGLVTQNNHGYTTVTFNTKTRHPLTTLLHLTISLTTPLDTIPWQYLLTTYVCIIARQVSALYSMLWVHEPSIGVSTCNLSELLSKNLANTTFEKIHLRPEVAIATPHPVTERASKWSVVLLLRYSLKHMQNYFLCIDAFSPASRAWLQQFRRLLCVATTSSLAQLRVWDGYREAETM